LIRARSGVISEARPGCDSASDVAGRGTRKIDQVMNRCKTGWCPLATKAVLLKALGVSAFLVLPSALAVPPPTGVAPVLIPAGGFSIEGDLLANTPVSGAGDWMTATNYPGAGGGVLDASGTPLNPATTYHFIDAYNSTADNTFSGGLKWTDNPNTWQ